MIKKLEGWPSGLRRTLGKRVEGNTSPGFESPSLRHALYCFYKRLVNLKKSDDAFARLKNSNTLWRQDLRFALMIKKGITGRWLNFGNLQKICLISDFTIIRFYGTSMGFFFGIVITLMLVIFASDIQSLMVESGIRDSLITWLENWS